MASPEAQASDKKVREHHPPILFGADNGFFGCKHTAETKAIIRIKATGRKRSEDSKLNQSNTISKRYSERLENGNVICARCRQEKPPIEYSAKKRRDGWPKYSYCKACHSDYERERKLKRFFHLTLEEDNTILSFQGEKCAICRRSADTQKFRLAVDHRHSDGLIRGRLCWFCNRILGIAGDDPDRLQSAADYLRKPPAVQALGREVFGLPGRTNTKKQRKLARKLEKQASTPVKRLTDEQQPANMNVL